jgi:thiol-disulfide isomerase/thioredoxin
LVYAPCAGPILAGVITVSAAQNFTVGRLAVAFSYGVGSAVVLYFLMLGGRRVVAPLRRRGPGLQVTMGAVMVVVALAMLESYDVRFENAIASDLPSFLITPTHGLEETSAARSALVEVRGEAAHGVGAKAASQPQSIADPAGHLSLPVLGKAPEFADTQQWFNTPGDRPLTLRGLRGRVVLVDFWTYSCINCLRTLPYLKAWDARYRKDGLTIVGVHTPEFPFEHEASNVEEAIKRNGLRYPVVQDNAYGTWEAYGNQDWPAEYFIDARGDVRYADVGEGTYGKKEEVIRELLAEAGHRVLAPGGPIHAVHPSDGVTTPETYLGAARAERFTNSILSPGLHDFGTPAPPAANEFAYHGRWRIGLHAVTAAGGSLDLNFGARRVYLVLGSPLGARRMRVMLDGRPIPERFAGADVHNGIVEVSSQRLYELVDLPRVAQHRLTLAPEKGVMGYAFTFG